MVSEKQIEDSDRDMNLLDLGMHAVRCVHMFLEAAKANRNHLMVAPELTKLAELGRQAGELANKR